MTREIGCAVRDGDAIAIRLEAGPRRGCYRVDAGEAPRLLAGRGAATLRSGAAPVGVIAPSKGLRVLRGGFCAGRGFSKIGAPWPTSAAAFLIPRAHLRAHYDRHDGPVPVLECGRRRAAAGPGLRKRPGEGRA
jgi:hypothetical protein